MQSSGSECWSARCGTSPGSCGPPHEAHQGDAIAFLRDARADIALCDPPYAGTTSYEVSLRPLDELLAGHPIQPDVSGFSKKDSLDLIEALFDASRHIPVFALSYRGPVFDLATLAELIGKYRRRVEAKGVKYAHLAALARDESKAKNQELILVGWN